MLMLQSFHKKSETTHYQEVDVLGKWHVWSEFNFCTRYSIAVRESGSVNFNGIVRAALMLLQKKIVLSTFLKRTGAANSKGNDQKDAARQESSSDSLNFSEIEGRIQERPFHLRRRATERLPCAWHKKGRLVQL